jgi:uncharacterized surface protein with fasciclin (FAS1) repeats
LRAADLVDILKGSGPFTVFAPQMRRFAKLPAATVENLLKPENKVALTKILTYHVVPGQTKHHGPQKADQSGNGKAELKTASGGAVSVAMQGKNIVLKDKEGDVDNCRSKRFPVEQSHSRGKYGRVT